MAFTTGHEATQARHRSFATSNRTLDPEGMASFVRGLRTIAEASLVAGLGFPVAVLLIAAPIALLARALHEGLSWLTRAGGVTGPFVEAGVAVASSVGGVTLFALSVRFVVRRFRLRRASRQRVKDSDSIGVTAIGHQVTEASI